MDFTDFDLRVGTVREAVQTGDVLELVIDFGGLVREMVGYPERVSA